MALHELVVFAEYFYVFGHFCETSFYEIENAAELCEEGCEVEDFFLTVLHADLDGCDEVLAALRDVLCVHFHV